MEKLIEAIDNEDLKTVKNLLKNGLKVDFVGSICDYNDNYGDDGENILNYASEYDNAEILKLLLDNGGSEYINHTSGYEVGESGTVLHVAAKHGNLEIIKLLLDYGADVNAKNEYGRTPLFDAMYIDLNDLFAETERYAEVVDLLLNYGADINAVDNDGDTAILALIADDPDCYTNALVDELFNRGADINIANNDGENLLMYCFAGENNELYNTNNLIRQSTIETINAQDADGRTPLIHAVIDAFENHNAEDAGVVEFIEELVKAGADMNIRDNEGETALSYLLEGYAENIKNEENIYNRVLVKIANKMLDYGLNLEDVYDTGINGQNFIITMIGEGDRKVVEYCKNNNIFNNIDFDNWKIKKNIYDILSSRNLPINVNGISNMTKNFIIMAINVANMDFGKKVNLPFNSLSAPMKDFVNFGINAALPVLTQEEQDSLDNVVTRFDNAIVNKNFQEIKNSINKLFKLCKTSQNIHNIVDSIIDKDIVYSNDCSLTKLLNLYGFNTKLFDLGMRTNQVLADGIRGINVLNAKMDDGSEMSIINKYFKIIYAVIFDEEMYTLSQNKDINNACFLYQQDATEKNKNNLINTIINNSNYETREMLSEYLRVFEFRVNKPGTPHKVAKFETLLNAVENNDFGTCLKNRLEMILQLNNNKQQDLSNLVNVDIALSDNQNQL